MARQLKGYRLSEEMFLEKLGIDRYSESAASVRYDINRGIVTIYTTGQFVPEIIEGGEVPLQRCGQNGWVNELHFN